VQRVRALPQDFMAAFGYALNAAGDAEPAQAEARRRRPLALSRTEFAETPILIATSVLGYSIVSLRQSCFAVPASAGPVDLATLSEAELAEFPRANTQVELFAALIAQSTAMRDVMRALIRDEVQTLLAASPEGDAHAGAS